MTKFDALLLAAWLASGSMALEDGRRVDITMTTPESASAPACHAAPALIDPGLSNADLALPFDVPMVDIAIVCAGR